MWSQFEEAERVFLFQPAGSDHFQLPPTMADTAPPIDKAYDFIFWFSVVFTVAITGALVYFVGKYKRKKGVRPEPTGHFMKLELFWTITPTIFIFFLFHAGFVGYIRNATAAEGATEIRARGKKWSWEFEYPTGDRIPAIPVGDPSCTPIPNGRSDPISVDASAWTAEPSTSAAIMSLLPPPPYQRRRGSVGPREPAFVTTFVTAFVTGRGRAACRCARPR